MQVLLQTLGLLKGWSCFAAIPCCLIGARPKSDFATSEASTQPLVGVHAQAVPLQFSAERASENPLEKWTRVLVGEANSAARKAISKGWSSLSRVGKAAFDSFQGTAPASDVCSPPVRACHHYISLITAN